MFEPVGQCIYCGSVTEPLSDEHIVPIALNGTLVLPRASCAECADITKKFEQTVARRMYGVLRIKRGFRTRRKKERPAAHEVPFLDSKGKRRVSLLPMADVPTIYAVLDLPPPGIMTGAPVSETNPALQIRLRGDTSEIAKAIAPYPLDAIELSADVDWGSFSRLLAKIAHSYLVAMIGQHGYVALLPDLILGKSRFLAHFVGGIDGPMEPEAVGAELAIAWRQIGGESFLGVYIQLLGAGRTPTYHVIAAKVLDVGSIETARGFRR